MSPTTPQPQPVQPSAGPREGQENVGIPPADWVPCVLMRIESQGLSHGPGPLESRPTPWR